MKTLVVVPCGKSKIWKKRPHYGSTEARFVYTGAPFIVNRKYVEHFNCRWVILSAKYGFMEPDFLIPEDYNVTFNDLKTNPISLKELMIQAEQYQDFDCIVALGGKNYSNIVRKVFTHQKVDAPTYGLPLGKSMSKVKKAVDSNKPFKCSDQ